MCAQIMGSFSSFFRTLLCSYHNIFYSCGSQDHWPSWFNWYLLIGRLLVSLFVMSLWHITLLQSLGLNIVCLPPSIYHWICVLHFTLLLINTQFMEEHNLYWPSKLLAHFGNRCQRGEVSESFVEKFRELSPLALVLFLSICILYACTIGCCIAQ